MLNTMLDASLYGTYRNKTFSEIFPDYETFNTAYTNCKLVNMTSNVEELYYLLYARYGNSPIANADENQFKYRLFATMYSYGPTWEKKLDIQRQIRTISADELMAGSKAIYNTALNPSTSPSMQSLEELPYINSQNTTNYKKSKIEALSIQYELLETSVTEEFISKFNKLFLQFVQPELPLLYEE